MATSATDQLPRVESPCVRKCTLDDEDICLGCFRSIDEICTWGGASNQKRLEYLELAAARRSRNSKRA